MSTRILIYARVSTEDQLEKYGLPLQLRACREYAKAHGLEVLEEITDDGISGTILHRPGLDRVRRLVREQAVGAVLSFDPDRLSRVLRDLLEVKAEADACNVPLLFVMATFDKTPSGELFFHIKGAVATYERTLFLERSMRGKRERAKSGLRVGGRTPFGYRDEGGSLIVEEDRAAVARQIFAWYDSGLSLCEITRRLRSSGVRTWSGKPWWYTSVRAILSNEVYAGVGHWGAERIALAVPPLVSREQWERVQLRLADNLLADHRANVGRPSVAYLLRGLIRCRCGLRMYGEVAKSGGKGTRTYHFYRCQARNKTLPHSRYCGLAVNATQLDAAAWKVLTETFTDPARLRAMVREHEAAARAVDPRHLEQLDAQAQRLRRREQALVEMMGDPDLAEDRAAVKRQYVEAQLERRRIEAEVAAGRRVAVLQGGDWIEEAVSLLREYVPTIASPEKRQEFVRGMVSRAEWTGEELQMACFIGPKCSSFSRESVEFPDWQILLTARLAA